ncbi:MAG: FIG00468870: hypothetical protein [uncultured Thermomicrobiales bacterium]|uniref:Xylose isomerase-like TIM barrel domain-containing protein n=1 Tax=uncultured Thermomicrobiales bacterium TaxID=1645740 RepID=A0A6J4UTZ5_9BACT|nr:MAG: FIG00468870: hypothetical protein [uncultured Thermomicrobiales bacterium]
MWQLSAFADEIDPDLDRQLDVLAGEAISRLDLRAAWHTNVLDLGDDELTRVATALTAGGVRVATVASPIGKIPIGDDFDAHLVRFRRALAVADRLDCRVIRVFSFFIPPGDDPARHREAVLDRLGRLTREAEAAGVTLLHENEKEIYGDTPTRCHDLLATLASPSLRAVWDPANFVQCGVRPFAEGYELLRPFVAAVHVKDARLGSGEVVPAGEGDGGWRETIAALRASGFDGVFSLEPHLTAGGIFSGFTGPALFGTAAAAFKGLLREQGIAWA